MVETEAVNNDDYDDYNNNNDIDDSGRNSDSNYSNE